MQCGYVGDRIFKIGNCIVFVNTICYFLLSNFFIRFSPADIQIGGKFDVFCKIAGFLVEQFLRVVLRIGRERKKKTSSANVQS